MEIFDCQGSNDILKDLIGAKRVFRWLSACYFRVLHHELANAEYFGFGKVIIFYIA